MSYCRFFWDDSDVYVYDGQYGIVCCGCSLDANRESTFETPEEMIEHLMEHRAAGDNVPEYALEGLREEAGLPRKYPERDFNAEHVEWLKNKIACGDDDDRTIHMLKIHLEVMERVMRDRNENTGDG